MATSKNKKSLQLLVSSLVTMFIIKSILLFMSGYNYFGGVVTSLVITVVSNLYNIFLAIWLLSIFVIFLKHKNFCLYIFVWVIALIFGQIPSGQFYTLGALYAMNTANAKNVVSDVISLAEEYPPMTCIGHPVRFPCDDPFGYEVLPNSIKAVHPSHVLILRDYVLLEKAGLEGVFRGFVIFYKGKDIWKDEEMIVLQENCNSCWRIRITDGLYWYYENSKFPIEFSPIQE